MIYKNLTTDCNLFEDLNFRNKNLEIIEPVGLYNEIQLKLVVGPQEQLVVRLEKIDEDEPYHFSKESMFSVSQIETDSDLI